MPPTDVNQLRLHLIERLLHAPAAELEVLERFLEPLPQGQDSASGPPPARRPSFDWPHAPLHRLSEEGTYIVTAATLDKAHLFKGEARLEYLQEALLTHVQQAGWVLEAWAIFSNHYHFVAHMQPGSVLLNDLLRKLHRATAIHINELDRALGRQVWFQFWETRLTFEASYLARLTYVHRNPVKHGLVAMANQYPWCSAAWFERTATEAQVKTLYQMKVDRVRVEDDFEPV
jgi:putative transposase